MRDNEINRLINGIELNFIIKVHMCRYESQAYNMH